MSEWELEASRQVRDLLIENSERHEEEQHGGQPCLPNRVGLVAFLMHALGLSAFHLPLVAEALVEYEAQHEAQHEAERERRNGHNGDAR